MKQTIFAFTFCLLQSVAFTQSVIDTSPKKIKILSWNIYMLPGIVGNGSMKIDRADAIGQLLASSDYDVIIFQEAFCPTARKKIREHLEANFPHQAGPANQKLFSLKVSSGLWAFSKYPIEATHSIIYKNRAGVDALSRKGAMLLELNVHGQLIQVAGTHMQNAGGPAIRHAQCTEFAERLLKPHAKAGVPQILCGDFNINKQTQESYQFMLATLAATDGELQGENKFSYDRLNNDLHVEKGIGQDLIDYILVRNNGAWVNCNNRQIKQLRKRWHTNHQDLSDHFSLEAEIVFSPVPAIASSK